MCRVTMSPKVMHFEWVECFSISVDWKQMGCVKIQILPVYKQIHFWHIVSQGRSTPKTYLQSDMLNYQMCFFNIHRLHPHFKMWIKSLGLDTVLATQDLSLFVLYYLIPMWRCQLSQDPKLPRKLQAQFPVCMEMYTSTGMVFGTRLSGLAIISP